MEFQKMSEVVEPDVEGNDETKRGEVTVEMDVEVASEVKEEYGGKQKKEKRVKKSKKTRSKKEKEPRSKKMKKKLQAKNARCKTVKYRVSLRRQVIGGFLIPIILIVLLSTTVYSTAEEGLIDNYKHGAMQTLSVTSQLLDSQIQHVEQLAFDLYLNDDIYYYSSGVYSENSYEAVEMTNNIKEELILKMADPLIADIYIIPKDGVKTLASTGLLREAAANLNVYSDVSEDFDFENYYQNSRFMWIGNHEKIDEYWERGNESYILSCFVETKNNVGMIVVDVNYDYFYETLAKIDIPEGASISYITFDGREINMGTEGIQGISSEEFYLDAVASEDISGNSMVEVNGENYLFMYQKCEAAGAVIAELVPESVIMEKAFEIKNSAILFSVLTIIIVALIGSFIATGLQRKLGRLQKSLKLIAEGDFTVKVEGEGNTAFGQVNKDMMNTISGVKHLINKVKGVAIEVSKRVEHVEESVSEISKSAVDINSAIGEIETGTMQQADDATDCLTNMDDLSNRILETSTRVDEVTGIADQTIERIEVGSEHMNQLITQSIETGRLSEDVGTKVLALAESSKQIESFISQIEDIADETNLLSLNASIEAARAGEAGRGFAVVATEIQKLSDNSMEASKKIAEVVKVILEMTEEAKISTEKAVASIEVQQVNVKETGENFEEMNKAVLTLLDKLNEVTEEINRMQKGREATLNGIENISSVSEETAAVSESVGLNATNQTELTDKLTEIAAELKTSTDVLLQEISLFTVE